MDTEKYKPGLDASEKEISMWRNYFLENELSQFKSMPDYHKNLLRAYFLSIPSESFDCPLKVWRNCLYALIQHLEENKN